MQIRPLQPSEWDEVAALIHSTTNAWYAARGLGPIFAGPVSDALLFPQVYETLDPGCCLVTFDETENRIVGSCFYRERETHFSLGIMNADPAYAGQSIARRILEEIVARSNAAGKPLRLVSSAFNLDSYSLYTRAGASPRQVFQDMTLAVPEGGFSLPANELQIRSATAQDVVSIADFEHEQVGIRREKDYRYFIENELGIWQTLVAERAGKMTGFLVSVDHPGSCMLGPGAMSNTETALALITAQLTHLDPKTPVFLVPADQQDLVESLYQLGARNCELHVAQCWGEYPELNGISMPSFMPETA